jgi:hypothetical protein
VALIGATLLLGVACHFALPADPVTIIAITGSFALVALVLCVAAWRRVGDAVASYRFAGLLLGVLAVASIAGTVVPPYAQIFHTLWFGALLGLFIAAVLVSAIKRFPPTWKTLGFFLCHVGLLLILGGTALSSALSLRGRLDLHTRGPAVDTVAITRAGERTGEQRPLGFTVKLEDFDVDSYEAQYRVAVYKIQPDGAARQLATFDTDVGAVHRLPDGARFRVISRAGTRAVVVELTDERGVREGILAAERRDAIFFGDRKALTFERRPDEIKAYRSQLTLARDGQKQRATLVVNDPVSFGGWTLYQANFDRADPGYSGLDAVHDPGVPWVFAGFALVGFGVPYMLNVAPWLRRRQQAGGQS